jgi:hypothetical protein
MKKILTCLAVMTALSACDATMPYETRAGVRLEVDGYPFKVLKFKNSNSYAAIPADFWCKNSCYFLPDDYPKAIKAVEKVSGCKVDINTFQVVQAGAVMSVNCRGKKL